MSITAIVKRHVWRPFDQIWSVANTYFVQSGYGDMSSFVSDIRSKNPNIINWWDISPGSIILVPFLNVGV